MNVMMAYLGHSGLQTQAGARVLNLEPNLARERVGLDAPLARPIPFREAISALHDVVINDLRFKPRDKTAYEQWKKNQRELENRIRREEVDRVKKEVLARRSQTVPPDIESQYRKNLKRYWKARRAYGSHLLKHDRDLWRKLMPYDPIITVADDVVFFECFSADESSYGCLTVDREDTFGKSDAVELGTTNVDYSWTLYNHMQGLRTYRETRFRIDPEGFDVATDGRAEYREEKIDLPDGWLHGFMQLQFAMGMATRRVELDRAAVYSLLAWLKRHKARTSPRAIRFELLDGKSPRLVLEPWEQPIVSHGTVYQGPEMEAVRVWGRRRLLVLARVLPLADGIDVYLLGTGLPSFWVVRMGSMRLTLGLSGWTANDWTRGSALDLLAAPQAPSSISIESAVQFLRQRRSVTAAEMERHLQETPATTVAVLKHLAHTGQAIHDLDAGVFRWRQVMPMALAEKDLVTPNPELAGAHEIVHKLRAKITAQQEAGERVLVTGKVDNQECELLLDRDGMIRRGKCGCGYFFKNGIRRGPCRHLFALRHLAVWREGN